MPTIHLTEAYLKVVRKFLGEHQYHKAREESGIFVKALENMFGPISSKSLACVQEIAFEVYTFHGNVLKHGSLRDSEIALEVFKKALALKPDNRQAEDNYDSLAFGLGLYSVDENGRMRVKR